MGSDRRASGIGRRSIRIAACPSARRGSLEPYAGRGRARSGAIENAGLVLRGRSERRSATADDDDDDPSDSLVDPATGLFSESFFRVALDSRVAAARRHLRPVAVVFVEVVDGLPNGEPTIVDANLVTDAIRETLREADTACRLRNGYFALLLEDTPENGAIWTVERIRRSLAQSRKNLTVWAGIACYPAHAFGSEEILDAAEQAIVAAREWRQDRIEVAAASE